MGRPNETLRGTIEGESATLGVRDIWELEDFVVGGWDWRAMTHVLCATFG